MKHFVAYHNTQRMGRPLAEGDALALLTNKSVQHLLHNCIWFVQGDGTNPKQYSLGSVFVASEVGESGANEFRRFARGPGHVFRPHVPLNDIEWFPEFFKAVAHFSLGVTEITMQQYVDKLISLASQAGYELPG